MRRVKRKKYEMDVRCSIFHVLRTGLALYGGSVICQTAVTVIEKRRVCYAKMDGGFCRFVGLLFGRKQ